MKSEYAQKNYIMNAVTAEILKLRLNPNKKLKHMSHRQRPSYRAEYSDDIGIYALKLE